MSLICSANLASHEPKAGQTISQSGKCPFLTGNDDATHCFRSACFVAAFCLNAEKRLLCELTLKSPENVECCEC